MIFQEWEQDRMRVTRDDNTRMYWIERYIKMAEQQRHGDTYENWQKASQMYRDATNAMKRLRAHMGTQDDVDLVGAIAMQGFLRGDLSQEYLDSDRRWCMEKLAQAEARRAKEAQA